MFHWPFPFTNYFCVLPSRLIPLKMWKVMWDFPRMFCSVTSPISSAVFQITCKIFVWFLTVLKSEVYDLRIVLHSADKELSAVKSEYSAFREKQEKEMSQLSGRHMDVQFQLDSVRYVDTCVKCLNLPSACIQSFSCSFLHVNLHFTSLILCLCPLTIFFSILSTLISEPRGSTWWN